MTQLQQTLILLKTFIENKFQLFQNVKIEIDPDPTLISACEMNVHKRCERFVPPLCGVNARELGELLGKLGTSSHNLSSHSNKKTVGFWVIFERIFNLNI